jgi:hypothetical protein
LVWDSGLLVLVETAAKYRMIFRLGKITDHQRDDCIKLVFSTAELRERFDNTGQQNSQLVSIGCGLSSPEGRERLIQYRIRTVAATRS